MLVESTILLERIKHTSMKPDNSIQDIDKHFRYTHTHSVVWLFGSLFSALICMRTIECLSVSSIAIGCFIVVVSTFPHTMLYSSLEANKENVRQSASHIWLRNKHTVRMLLLWIVVDSSTCHACPQSSKANVQQISTSLLLLYYGLVLLHQLFHLQCKLSSTNMHAACIHYTICARITKILDKYYAHDELINCVNSEIEYSELLLFHLWHTACHGSISFLFYFGVCCHAHCVYAFSF